MSRLAIGIVLVLALAGLNAIPAWGDPPDMSTGGGPAGSLENPCNGHLVLFETTDGRQISGTNFGHFTGTGTGVDQVTGEIFAVTYNGTGTSAQDSSGSFTGHTTIVFKGASNTFVYHLVANGNFRPGDVTGAFLEFVSCATEGSTGF